MSNYTAQREAIAAEQEKLQAALDNAQKVAAQAQAQIQSILQRGAQLDGKLQLLDELEKADAEPEPKPE